MRKTSLMGLALALIAGCPGDDSSEDDTAAMTMTMGMTMSSSGATATDTDDTAESGSSGDAACPDDSLSHAADIQPIWDDNCVEGCHTSDGVWSPLLLSDGDAYDAIVDATGLQTIYNPDHLYIAPMDVENSYLLHKLRGTHVDVVGEDNVAAVGAQMPVEVNPDYDMDDPDSSMFNEIAPLSDGDLQTIEDWVNCGAPE